MINKSLLTICLTPLTVVVAPALAADYLTVEQAQQQMFADATQFVDSSLTLSDEQRDQIKAKAGVRQRSATVRVWRAQQEQQTLGWLLVDEVIGKHEMITYATAISVDGRVLGVEILSYRETHGGQIRGQAWRDQFKNKALTQPVKLGQDIVNISGATLSCRNVTDGVRRLLVIHDLLLRHAG
jgi:Na+-translocating ferredoxin:NAD+ oxidoreductase RnfG subunit